MDGHQTTTEAEIVVRGYTPRFLDASDHVLGIEGGHVNDPVDRGGETQFGISLRFLIAEGAIDLDHDGFADFDLDMDGDIDGADIRLLTQANARALFWRCFWQRLGCENWPKPIGEMLFDQAVNGGATAARKLLQRAINACLMKTRIISRPDVLKIDGVLGDHTRSAFDWVYGMANLGPSAIVIAFRDAAADRYRAIAKADPSQSRFLRGWLRRAAQLGRG
tara:strand:+ start:1106 stop:1768 length:663 start_codon:yes stop_codon:yes gene_type:complete